MKGLKYIARQISLDQQRRQIEEQLRQRQHLRDMDRNKRRLQTMIDDVSSKSVDAELAGNHKQAVQLAAEVQRLKRCQQNIGVMSAQAELVMTVSEANRAMSDMMDSSGTLAREASRMFDPAAMAQVQADLMVTDERMKMMADHQAMLYEDMDMRDDADGEACLNEIMKSHRQKKQNKLLEDTRRQLSRLNHTISEK